MNLLCRGNSRTLLWPPKVIRSPQWINNWRTGGAAFSFSNVFRGDSVSGYDNDDGTYQALKHEKEALRKRAQEAMRWHHTTIKKLLDGNLNRNVVMEGFRFPMKTRGSKRKAA